MASFTCLATISMLLVGGCGRPAPVVETFDLHVKDIDGELEVLHALDLRTRRDVVRAGARHVDLGLGAQTLALEQVPSHGVETRHANDTSFQHVAIVVSDMDAAVARLSTTRTRPVSSEAQTLPRTNPVAGGVRALYFRDPEGHFMELLQFPPDKGDPSWHAPPEGRIFLGIDHSAIVVKDTAASVRFYRDVLGFHVVSESVNSGTEQERLSGVTDAHVRVTTLRGASGPGIELLEYLTPRDGARDTSSDWAIVVRGTRAKAGITHDPDGHTVRIE